MGKKINCKHGLSPKEELEARRIRQKIMDKDEETISVLRQLFFEWLIDDNDGRGHEHTIFGFYLLDKNKIYYSALSRLICVDRIYNKILCLRIN